MCFQRWDEGERGEPPISVLQHEILDPTCLNHTFLKPLSLIVVGSTRAGLFLLAVLATMAQAPSFGSPRPK